VDTLGATRHNTATLVAIVNVDWACQLRAGARRSRSEQGNTAAIRTLSKLVARFGGLVRKGAAEPAVAPDERDV
jgi:hypothetical protein